MAEKDILFERVLTVPMRKMINRPKTRRGAQAISHLRKFVARHTDTFPEDIWIDEPVNKLIWARSIKKPPKQLKVRVIKWDDQTVEVDLPEE